MSAEQPGENVIVFTEHQLAEAIHAARPSEAWRIVRSMLVALLTSAVVALAVTLTVAHHNCENVRSLAAVAREESEEANSSSRSFEAKSRDRLGLTRSDFEKFVQEGQERRERHLRELKRVVAYNCDVLP